MSEYEVTGLGWKSDEAYLAAVEDVQAGDVFLQNLGNWAGQVTRIDGSGVWVRIWVGMGSVGGVPYQMGIDDMEDESDKKAVTAEQFRDQLRGVVSNQEGFWMALVPRDCKAEFVPEPWVCQGCRAILNQHEYLTNGGFCTTCGEKLDAETFEAVMRQQFPPEV